MTAQRLRVQFALPNFYFHVVTAYEILRHNGVAARQARLHRRHPAQVG